METDFYSALAFIAAASSLRRAFLSKFKLVKDSFLLTAWRNKFE
jgi:hypothetical protein